MERNLIHLDYINGQLLSRSSNEYPDLSLYTLFAKHNAIQIHNAFSVEECNECVKKIYSLQNQWNKDYDGEQYSLGQNYYASVNANETNKYLKASPKANALIDTQFPSIRERIFQILGVLLPAEKAQIKAGWTGPSFVIFPEKEFIAKNSGPIHIDTEGLVDSELEDPDAEVFSLIGMLQKPQNGGGLRIWDIRYFVGCNEDELLNQAQSNYSKGTLVNYELGDIVIIDSLCAHQILSFDGPTDRITINSFATRLKKSWFIWF